MAKKKNEDMCPECEIALDEDGNCPSCGWSKESASAKEDEGETSEEELDDDE